MANEITPARTNALPERTLRIDGERTAAMYTLSIRVARLDTRLRELAGNPSSEGRKQYRKASEGFSRLLGAFEDGLAEVEKDAEMNSRRGPRVAGNAQPRGARGPRQQPEASRSPQQQSQPAPKSPPAQAAPIDAKGDEPLNAAAAKTSPAEPSPKDNQAGAQQPQDKNTAKNRSSKNNQGNQKAQQDKGPQKHEQQTPADVVL